jgi:hypothetical protein
VDLDTGHLRPILGEKSMKGDQLGLGRNYSQNLLVVLSEVLELSFLDSELADDDQRLGHGFPPLSLEWSIK